MNDYTSNFIKVTESTILNPRPISSCECNENVCSIEFSDGTQLIICCKLFDPLCYDVIKSRIEVKMFMKRLKNSGLQPVPIQTQHRTQPVGIKSHPVHN